MKKIIVFLFLFCFLNLSFYIPVSAQKANFQLSEKAFKWADKQLKKMSADDKVGQLVHIGINAKYLNQDSYEFKELKRQIVENKLGGIVLFGAPIYESVFLVNRMQETAKTPLLIAIDAETGVGMRFGDAENFPWNMAMAATGNPEFARRVGVITGREARALGITQIYAPVMDVNNNAENPVINVRSYGENPAEVGRFGAAFIEGLQSQNVIATAKHFPGHGDTAVDSHRGLPIINLPRSRLNQVELPPFQQAINAGVASIMVAHIALPQIDGTEIKPLKNYHSGRCGRRRRNRGRIGDDARNAFPRRADGNFAKGNEFSGFNRHRCNEYERFDDLFQSGRSRRSRGSCGCGYFGKTGRC